MSTVYENSNGIRGPQFVHDSWASMTSYDFAMTDSEIHPWIQIEFVSQVSVVAVIWTPRSDAINCFGGTAGNLLDLQGFSNLFLLLVSKESLLETMPLLCHN